MFQLYCKQKCCPLEPNTDNSSFASRLDETDAVIKSKCYFFTNFEIYLTVRFNGHFSGGPGFAGTRMSRFQISLKQDDGGGGNSWSYKACKAPAKLSPSANQHGVFLYGPDALPVTQPTLSKH